MKTMPVDRKYRRIADEWEGKSRPGYSETRGGPRDLRLRTVMCWVLAILLAIVLTIGTLISSVFFGLLNENVVRSAMVESDYYADALEYFYEASYDLTLPTGLPVDVLADLVLVEQIQGDINGYLASSFKGISYPLDTTVMEAELIERAAVYVEETEQLEMTPESEAAIQEYVTEISEQYASTVRVSAFIYIGSFHKMFVSVVLLVIPLGLLFTAAITYLIARMFHYRHKGMRYAAFSTLSATLMTGIIPVVLLIGKPYLRLGLSPEFFYNFFMSYVEKSLWIIIFCALSLLVLSAVLIAWTEYRRRGLVRRKAYITKTSRAIRNSDVDLDFMQDDTESDTITRV